MRSFAERPRPLDTPLLIAALRTLLTLHASTLRNQDRVGQIAVALIEEFMTDLWKTIEHPIVVWTNNGGNWLTKQIQQINQRKLVVEIAIALRGAKPESVGGIDGVYPLEIKPESDGVRFVFCDFIAYSVTEEMFAQHSDQEDSVGDWLRIFSKSFFLDFVGRSTWATSEFPGKLTHYQINTLDHTIDIATSNPPEILKLTQ